MLAGGSYSMSLVMNNFPVWLAIVVSHTEVGPAVVHHMESLVIESPLASTSVQLPRALDVALVVLRRDAAGGEVA